MVLVHLPDVSGGVRDKYSWKRGVVVDYDEDKEEYLVRMTDGEGPLDNRGEANGRGFPDKRYEEIHLAEKYLRAYETKGAGYETYMKYRTAWDEKQYDRWCRKMVQTMRNHIVSVSIAHMVKSKERQ